MTSLLVQLEARDRELADIRPRMHAYELGVYGLHEAVKEIKEYKTKVICCYLFIFIYILYI